MTGGRSEVEVGAEVAMRLLTSPLVPRMSTVRRREALAQAATLTGIPLPRLAEAHQRSVHRGYRPPTDAPAMAPIEVVQPIEGDGGLDGALDAYHSDAGGEVVAPIAAAEFLAAVDPDELAAWLRGRAAQLVAGELIRRNRAAARRQRSKAGAFGEAAASDNPEALTVFTKCLVVDDQLRRRPVGQMTSADHRWVAGAYTARSNRDRMLAAFHHAVAKRLGPGQTTADVMDEATYVSLLGSITGDPAAAPAA